MLAARLDGAAPLRDDVGARPRAAGGVAVDVPGLIGERWLAYLDGRWRRDGVQRAASGRQLLAAPYARPNSIERATALELDGALHGLARARSRTTRAAEAERKPCGRSPGGGCCARCRCRGSCAASCRPSRSIATPRSRSPCRAEFADLRVRAPRGRAALAARGSCGSCGCSRVLAAARPQFVGEPVALPMTGRDLLLSVDLSGSMEEQDFQLDGQWVDRLTAMKAVATDFIERRVGDRVGLILFGREAYLQAPLTFDRETVSTLLDESVIGLAGKETAIGDAIGLAIRTLEDAGVEQGRRVLILLTDGANTAGAVEPRKAAELAAQRKMVIYTIGIGADSLTVRSLFGLRADQSVGRSRRGRR